MALLGRSFYRSRFISWLLLVELSLSWLLLVAFYTLEIDVKVVAVEKDGQKLINSSIPNNKGPKMIRFILIFYSRNVSVHKTSIYKKYIFYSEDYFSYGFSVIPNIILKSTPTFLSRNF